MHASLHSKEVTTAQVTSVRFGFFNDDEIRKLSVKRIESPIVVDNNSQPVADGLYDPAMGPLDPRERCVTCGLMGSCPGHFGHIELAVPVYNPLVFSTLYKLLRSSCLQCFRLRMKASEVELYASRLRLLARGRLADGAAVETNVRRGTEAGEGRGKGKTALETGGVLGDRPIDLSDDEAGAPAAGSPAAAAASPTSSAGSSPRAPGTPPRDDGRRDRTATAPTAHTLEAMQDTITELFRRQPPGRCANCSAFSPVVKREGLTKLFLVPLPPKRAAANAARNLQVLPTLSRLRRPTEADAERTLADRLGAAEAAAGTGWGRGSAGEGAQALPRLAPETTRELVAALAAAPVGGEEAARLQEQLDAARARGDSGIPGPKLEAVQTALDAAVASTAGGYVAGAAEGAARPSAAQLAAAERAGAGLGAGVEASRSGGASQLPAYLTPAEVFEIMRAVWAANEGVLSLVYPTDVAGRARRRGGSAASAAAAGAAAARAAQLRGFEEFFLRTVAVAPNRFRAPSRMGGVMYDHPQNALLVRALNDNLELLRLRSLDSLSEEAQGADARVLYRWLGLQNAVNAFIDSAAADGRAEGQGIRQTLEKKEGLFRKNMMGKRVNFAARSVISPDPGLNGGEIGVPPYIAARLSYPERVTPWNTERLCEAVLAGPGRNPGATAVEDERGRVLLLRDDRASREAVARRLAADARRVEAGGSAGGEGAALAAADAAAAPELSKFGGCKVVYRSLEDGDIMLTNRQPTLHKPGVLAHRARIMRGERTIRMHYANCSTFNADFDGDEINIHLPQDQLGRAEGYGIVGADHQFCVPTDGKPLRGLIQDHVVAGTLLTARDAFLDRGRFAGLVHEAVGADCHGAWEVWLPEPAVVKPRELFTGKQVLTAVLVHYTRDQLPFSLETPTKVPVSEWGASSGEGRLVVRNSHLVAGVIDKAAFGKHGLLHLFHELYGPRRTSLLTSALSRLFTLYLQQHGFTCGLADVALDDNAEARRAGLLVGADDRCASAAAGIVSVELGLDGAEGVGAAPAPPRPRVRGALRARLRANPDLGALLDMKSSGAMHPLSSEVVKSCLPSGQVRAFRHNMMALMTVTGAKGSVVNFSQISCLLGQQELEGRRVPRMASGKTLPCFEPFDVGARSGGFVGDRFLTGLRPQEYYFHCMAGREGLVDTTVKTSRSGYLQRCLVKNLETLKVSYDGTVRDDADASLVQFAYGEDGIDTTKVGCLRTLPFFYYNMAQLSRQLGIPDVDGAEAGAGAGSKRRKGKAGKAPRGGDAPIPPPPAEDAAERFRDLAKAVAEGRAEAHLAGTLPAAAALPASVPGVTSEGFQAALASAMFGGVLRPPTSAAEADAALASRAPGPAHGPVAPLDPAAFVSIMAERYQRSLSAPGEAVGVIAAQSIGEPSTQMTLNTFHMAGRGEANVTLGIPRLREILMTAARTIKTPVMTMPIRADAPPGAAATLAARLRRVLLAETLRGLRVEHAVLTRVGEAAGTAGLSRSYTITLRFHHESSYPAELGLRFRELAVACRAGFVPRLQAAIRAEIRRASTGSAVASVTLDSVGEGASAVRRSAGAGSEGGASVGPRAAAADDDDAPVDGDDDDEREADPDNLDAKMSRGGGGAERATYESEDEDDAALADQARREAARRSGFDLAVDDEDEGGGDGGDGGDEDADAARQGVRSTPAPAGPGAGRGASAPDDSGEIESAPGVLVDPKTRTVRVRVHVPQDAPVLLMREVAERVASEVVVRGTKGVSKCYVLDGSQPGRGGRDAVQTDGINVAGAWAHSDLADVDQLGFNSPGDVLASYGVEAARASIVGEVGSVFGAYGIGVDPRHLSLIADVMTRRGAYAPLNRLGIQASPSPFLKITFETAAAFLVAATLHGNVDSLRAPASRIVLGQPVALGTGALQVIHDARPGL